MKTFILAFLFSFIGITLTSACQNAARGNQTNDTIMTDNPITTQRTSFKKPSEAELRKRLTADNMLLHSMLPPSVRLQMSTTRSSAPVFM